MAFLRTTKGRAGAAGFLLAASLAGCALLTRGGPEPLAFSHRLHVEQEELDCVICHEDAYTGDAPGMPHRDTCLLCHEELDGAKPEERRVASLFEGEDFRAGHRSRLAEELVFSHVRHVGAELACDDCHDGIGENERLTAAIGVSMQGCVDCHAARAVPRECSTCHTEVSRDWRPPSHERHWTRRHGQASHACERGTSADCFQCHAERECADCHLVEPPASHTWTFRRRSHGLVAAMDRATCAACHRQDSCDACHESTRPMSHVGQWGGTRSRHCLGCHLPLTSNGCAACHQDASSHLLAPPKPDWHDPAMNCRQCHGISAPLPHVDKGDDCNACHF